jgi:hypothetical protein
MMKESVLLERENLKEARESSRDGEKIFYPNKVFRCKSFQFLQKNYIPSSKLPKE